MSTSTYSTYRKFGHRLEVVNVTDDLWREGHKAAQAREFVEEGETFGSRQRERSLNTYRPRRHHIEEVALERLFARVPVAAAVSEYRTAKRNKKMSGVKL